MTTARTALGALAAAAALAACRSAAPAPVDIEPLKPLARVDVEYRALLAGGGFEMKHAEPASDSEPGTSEAYVALQCHLLEVSDAVADALLSELGPGIQGAVVARADARRLLDLREQHSGLELATSPRLSVREGVHGSISVRDQTALVQSYEMKPSAGGLMADPVVTVAVEGALLDLVARDADAEGVEVDLELVLSDLQGPPVEARGTLPGTRERLTLQLPVFATQRLKARARIGRDQTLAIGAVPFEREGRRMLLLVNAQPWTPGELPDGTQTALAAD